ncbi:DUF349 domain-containing protein [Reichenbachiella agarivorans]|uniref:DUF349 domain-containing protein n=1 Tax=Reichenbachiella agarivorans TaxID=2979464 RepID=A0ABY6CKY1_9BACT|nr:DUF349 domain-containing protein [Reichenbachiella agarivorans]UXP31172.1 DUF349 domain-containing protein [Reichenbachiella agarivorans]
MKVPFGHIEDGVLYRDASGDYSELKLKEVAEEELEQVVSFYEQSFDKLSQKFSEVEAKISSSNNKGSFLSSLLNLKEQLSTHQGLGDYTQLAQKIDGNVNLLTDYVAKNRQKNTDIKNALLLELEAILSNNDLEEAFEQIKDLKAKWIKTGSPSEELKEQLEQQFKEGVDSFFEKRNAFHEDKRELVDSRVAEYDGIIAKLENILKGKGLVEAHNQVVALQAEWKEVGRIPEAAFKDRNEKYWSLCQTFFDKKKIEQKESHKNRAKTKKESLQQRTKVLEAMQKLVDEGLVAEVAPQMKKIATDWKNCGPLSRNENAEVHDQYLALSRSVQERQFLLKLTKRKTKGFDTKSNKEQLQSLQKVARDLLRRDETELSTFQENLDKMHINKGTFVDMLEAKLKTQQDKVVVKRALLDDIQKKIKEEIPVQ